MSSLSIELYQAGRLDEAVEQSIAFVKSKPADSGARFELAELSCIAGELERADRQLETVSNQDPQAALGAALFRQLVRAEMSRRECFYKGRVPEFIGEPSPQLASRLRAIAALRGGEIAEAASLIHGNGASATSDSMTWLVNNVSVDTIRDLDDLLGPVLEVLTSTGKYFWIGWDQILSVKLHPPKRPIDLLWRQASVSIEGGPDGDVYLPNIYIDPLPGMAADPSLQLGRSTDWVDVGSSVIRGRGQKTLLVGDNDLPFMQLEAIERQE
jgi:type VI secretion system protein ImpE